MIYFDIYVIKVGIVSIIRGAIGRVRDIMCSKNRTRYNWYTRYTLCSWDRRGRWYIKCGWCQWDRRMEEEKNRT